MRPPEHEADRHTDALVAEHCLGYRWSRIRAHRDGPWCKTLVHPSYSIVAEPQPEDPIYVDTDWDEYDRNATMPYGGWVPQFSTDIAAAMALVERYAMELSAPIPGHGTEWGATAFDRDSVGNWKTAGDDAAPTAALAICRAALNTLNRPETWDRGW